MDGRIVATASSTVDKNLILFVIVSIHLMFRRLIMMNHCVMSIHLFSSNAPSASRFIDAGGVLLDCKSLTRW
jgi:hypothetical protein